MGASIFFLLRGGGGYFEEGFHFGTLWYCYYFLLLHQHDADTGDHIEWSGWTTELHSMWSPVSVSHPCCWSPNKDCYNWGTWSPNKLITIPKHINDMEDLLSHPIWCLSLVAFASISLLLCFYFSFHFFPDSTNATYEKNREENKNQHKSVSWQPMVTCKHNMAHCSLAYVKR